MSNRLMTMSELTRHVAVEHDAAPRDVTGKTILSELMDHLVNEHGLAPHTVDILCGEGAPIGTLLAVHSDLH